ncbi:TauD/TfdA family dioxygenase [Altererythrobacter salegens]|uniref:TauD/TfdA family dioxygenase n=1 Tax=Croceibacterium salegens TaxID=1737568 RepID=A0A6I4SW50_9SPHN|nr:TauD/TfdA family dioxygenase [Croceibacterium salegens]MXO60245.1 TauD/TfdA family dioxygenase [Croceibacterium salegens]
MNPQVELLEPCGAMLTDVDCAQLDTALVTLIEDLMREHAVLVIRGKGHLDDEQHLAFSRAFGPLELPSARPNAHMARVAFGLYDVSNLGPDGEIADPDGPRAKIAKGNELFHADSSFNDLPSKWSILRGVIVTPEGGATELIDGRKVYDALSDASKARIAGLEVEHDYFHSRRKAGATVPSDSPLAPYMRAVHPLVRTSASGRPTLFVGAHAARILGMDEAESTALIEELLAFATQRKFVYAHKWQAGDIVIWDNRCTLHRGTEYDYRRYKRDMRRSTVNEGGEERSAIPAHLSLQMLSQPQAEAR